MFFVVIFVVILPMYSADVVLYQIQLESRE